MDMAGSEEEQVQAGTGEQADSKVEKQEAPPEVHYDHPLVSLVFWLMGKKIEEKKRTISPSSSTSLGGGGGMLKERTLSWKDEKGENIASWMDDFGGVRAPDVELRNPEDYKGQLKPQLRPKAMQSGNGSDGGGGTDSESSGHRSPNSPNWGFFVSITPPQATLYAKNEEKAVASSSSS